MRHELLLLFLRHAQNGQSSGSVVHDHAVHRPAAAAHLAASASPTAHVHRTGLHLSPSAASTRRRPNESQAGRLATEEVRRFVMRKGSC